MSRYRYGATFAALRHSFGLTQGDITGPGVSLMSIQRFELHEDALTATKMFQALDEMPATIHEYEQLNTKSEMPGLAPLASYIADQQLKPDGGEMVNLLAMRCRIAYAATGNPQMRLIAVILADSKVDSQRREERLSVMSYLLARKHWMHFEFVLAQRALASILTVADVRKLLPQMAQAQPKDRRLMRRTVPSQAETLLQALVLAMSHESFDLAHEVLAALEGLDGLGGADTDQLKIQVRAAELKIRENRSSEELAAGLEEMKELIALADFVLTDTISKEIRQIRDAALDTAHNKPVANASGQAQVNG